MSLEKRPSLSNIEDVIGKLEASSVVHSDVLNNKNTNTMNTIFSKSEYHQAKNEPKRFYSNEPEVFMQNENKNQTTEFSLDVMNDVELTNIINRGRKILLERKYTDVLQPLLEDIDSTGDNEILIISRNADMIETKRFRSERTIILNDCYYQTFISENEMFLKFLSKVESPAPVKNEPDSEQLS